MNTDKRLIIQIQGAVQGVGFRPFVYNLAHELELRGWVSNSAQGVQIEVEGTEKHLLQFSKRLAADAPVHAYIVSLDKTWAEPCGYVDFVIRESANDGTKSALILPDLATCPECRREILDPENRRYRYPFTNCTHCGPRFSIIRDLPYDREQTTMREFTMCAACQAEYDNPSDRRFHAQPNACPDCGPQLALWDKAGNVITKGDDALLLAAESIRQGKIVACKGLGGFHLMVDARNQYAVDRLRLRKNRPDKPLATMFPALEKVQACCDVSIKEADILQSSAAPIVLLQVRDSDMIAGNVAPDNPYLGVMLPYTPLHILLMDELGVPIVATSGNLSDEPICTDEYEALKRLAHVADAFLVHNRPIERPVDDSVVQVINDEIQVLRCARGYAPLSLSLHEKIQPALAVGGHLKNTIAVTNGEQVLLSQHIGDLDNAATYEAFRHTITDLEALYDIEPRQIIHDMHPDYLSTQSAQTSNLQMRTVQHHIAHVYSGMLDNHLTDSVLGVAWDGTGYGVDNTIWGGEWFLVNGASVERVAYLRPFALIGGNAAVQEPRRSALGVAYGICGDSVFHKDELSFMSAFTPQEKRIFHKMLVNQVNTPQTSSMGRLFDAVASILDLQQCSTFEGQAAMLVEFEAMKSMTQDWYPFGFAVPEIDWRPMLKALIDDVVHGVSSAEIAAKFHNTLVEMVIIVAEHVGEEKVLLTGGCYQNRLLTQKAILRLREAGLVPYWHHHIPPNDGGIASGQIAAMVHHRRGDSVLRPADNERTQSLCV